MANDRPKRRNTLKNYNIERMLELASDDEGAVPQQTVDSDSGSEEDDYKVDASNHDDDDEEEMAVDEDVNMDELDIRVPEEKKPAQGTSRGKTAADEDDYATKRANWPMVRRAGYYLAHPPFETLNAKPTGTNKGKAKAKGKGKGQSKDVPNSGWRGDSDSNSGKSNVESTVKGSASPEKPLTHIQRAWMNSHRPGSKYHHLGFQDLFSNNNNRLQEGGPMNDYTEYRGKVGACLEKEGLHPNLTQEVLQWLRDTTGKVGWPETIEERQLVRCDENFGEHVHQNPAGHRSIACSHAHARSDAKDEYRLEGDFLFCHACADHQHQDLTADEANAIQNGALAPMCEECAVHYATSDQAGFGTLDCDCDLEPRCLAHRKAGLQGLHASLAAFTEQHATPKRRGAHDPLSDGCPTARCPACRANTPPPVGTHFAYMCVRCQGAVVLPPPDDPRAWNTHGPRHLQDFVRALGRPQSHANLRGVEHARWSAIMDAYIRAWEARHGPCSICAQAADDDDDDDASTSDADPAAEQRALDHDILAADAMDVDSSAGLLSHPTPTTHASSSGTKRKRAASDADPERVPATQYPASGAMLPPPTPKRQRVDGATTRFPQESDRVVERLSREMERTSIGGGARGEF